MRDTQVETSLATDLSESTRSTDLSATKGVRERKAKEFVTDLGMQ